MATDFFLNIMIFLVAAVLIVPLFKRIGFGEVLGYLAAGVVIGPSVLGLVPGPQEVLQFAQVGIVLLLFVIGLELQPSRLRAMRKPIFGLGSLQVAVTTAVLSGVALLFGLPLTAALVVGFSLGLCSTPLVLQLLAEKKELQTGHGRHAFALLLFQDLAAIPVLAAIPIIAAGSLFTENPGQMLLEVAIAVGSFLVLIIGGRHLLRPLFRFSAGTGSREVFAGTALMVVIGAALLMDFAGLSTALGAFIAGMLLADSEYRHNIEADIEPFKGLLLGLFFMAVGMTTQIGLLLQAPLLVLGLVLGLLLFKWLTVVVAARMYGLRWREAGEVGLLLSQGGEFAFVLLTAALGAQLLGPNLVDLLILVISLSMATTPVLFLLWSRTVRPWLEPPRVRARPFDTPGNDEPQVIIVGFGRFGQVVGRVLQGLGIRYTVLDANPEQVDFVRRYGNKVYFGDAGRIDLLEAAGVSQARVMVLAIGDVEASLRVVERVREGFPELRIYARARSRHHAHLLMRAGVHVVIRELLFSSLELTRNVLCALDVPRKQADRIVTAFRAHDEQTLKRQMEHFGNETQLIQSVREASDELRSLFESDAEITIAPETGKTGRKPGH
ncbi:MAG: cation:proton antiporter [Ectothiorhodospiraceae bacterium]|nr:cation:proton antiporter [Ectothiorhodospiraceae bacterium]MCH8505286.1 monovalent cation:proton antiporter-2 (CPA2) family protein [Ectothiorhodospiraceae bacterium]